MAERFYSLVTNVGKAKIANSAILGEKLNIVTVKVGDGNGAYYEPTEAQTDLVSVKWSGNAGSIYVDENNSNWIVIETPIPATVGGFTIREVGIYDDEQALIGITKCPATYKPVLDEGTTKDMLIRTILEVSNTASITLKIDPTVTLASRKYVDEKIATVSIPDASLTLKGKTSLSNAIDSDSETTAATPKAVKAAALQAKSYTDDQIGLVTATGIPKLVSYPLQVTATEANQTTFDIPLDTFDVATDTLIVIINRAFLDASQYTVKAATRDASGELVKRAELELSKGVNVGSKISLIVLKNVPIGADGSINGAVLATDSVPINRVNGLQDALNNAGVELSNAVDGTRETVAATEKALKVAYDRANEAFQSASSGKNAVATAITGKGVPATGSDTFDELATKIDQISTGPKYASGTTVISTGFLNFNTDRGTSTERYIVVSGLNMPKGIKAISARVIGPVGSADAGVIQFTDESYSLTNSNVKIITMGGGRTFLPTGNAYVNNTEFRIPAPGNTDGAIFKWEVWGK